MSGTNSGLAEPTTVGIVTTTSNVRQLSDGNGQNGGPGTGLGQSVNDKVGFFGVTPVVQPGQNGLPNRITANVTIFASTQTPSAVGPNTSAEQTFTVTGLIAGTEVYVTKPSVTLNLVVAGARVSAANTLAINFANNSGASITPPSEAYSIAYFTTEAPAAGSSTILPSQRGSGEAAMAQLGLLA